MTDRMAHLVGSLPGSTAEQAMESALQILGPRCDHSRTVRPVSGATGSSRLSRACAPIPTSKRTDPATGRITTGRGRTLYGANLDFGHVDAVRAGLPGFERLRTAYAGQSGITVGPTSANGTRTTSA